MRRGDKLLPAGRASFAKLSINGDHWGLSLNVEQVDKIFLRQQFGKSEDGNLFKGDPQGWLVWVGLEQQNYYDKYEPRTNESANDWSDLLDLIDQVDNSALQAFPDAVEAALHLRNFLFRSAFYNLYISLDSCVGVEHYFHLYHRDDSDRFTMLP